MRAHSRLDVKSAFNRKAVHLGNGAWGAFLRLVAWSNDNLSDGQVDETLIRSIASDEEFSRLRTPFPWGPGPMLESTNVPGVFFLHDFFEWNDPAHTVAARREAKSRGGKTRAQQLSSGPPAGPPPASPIGPPAGPPEAHPPAQSQHAGVGVGVVSDLRSGSEEGNQEPREPEAPAAAARIPPEWEPSPAFWQWVATQGFDRTSVQEHVGEFRDYWLGKKKDAERADWDATLRNWIRRKARDGEVRALPPAARTLTLLPPPDSPEDRARMAALLADLTNPKVAPPKPNVGASGVVQKHPDAAPELAEAAP